MPIDAIAQRLQASSDENFVIGAFVNERLVGTAGFFRSQGPKVKHKGRVWGVYVDPVFRRTGIGRSLMEALLVRLRQVDDLVQVSLTVAATQPAALALYASLGFRSFGTEPRALRVGADFVDEQHQVLMLDAL